VDTAKEAAGAAAAAAGQAADAAREAASAAVEGAKETAAKAGEAAQEMATKVAEGAQSMAESATGAAGTTAAATAAAPAAAAGKPGDQVYNMGCVACHATGAANAPKLDDQAAWETRAANGFDALVASVLNGKNAMPPKGGVPTLSEADIQNAVRYMLEQAGVEAGG
jgi:cytochrome c5